MAIDVTINLSDDLESELIAQTDDFNKAFPSSTPLSPSQFLRQDVRGRLQIAAQQREDAERLGLRAAFKLATPEEQATINGILDKYR